MSSDIEEIAKNIKAVISDVDGVFNDNRILEGAPYKAKFRSYYDGQGVSLLRHIGVHICLVTNERGERAKSVVDMVEKWNELPSSAKGVDSSGWAHVVLHTGVGGHEKVRVADEWLKGLNLSFADAAYMGDDILDAPLLKKVALSAAPAQAEEVIRDFVDFVSVRNGGGGGFRDLANFILRAKGVDPLELPFE